MLKLKSTRICGHIRGPFTWYIPGFRPPEVPHAKDLIPYTGQGIHTHRYLGIFKEEEITIIEEVRHM